jgi:hypothetical protein
MENNGPNHQPDNHHSIPVDSHEMTIQSHEIQQKIAIQVELPISKVNPMAFPSQKHISV